MSSQIIKCPECGHQFALDDVLAHQLEEAALKAVELKHQQALAQAIEKAKSQVSSDLELKLKSLSDQAAEEKERNKKLMVELLEQGKMLRQAQVDKEASALELQKKLAESEAKLKIEIKTKADEEHALKGMEKDKIIADLQKSLSDAQRKAEQGSQQTQGEVLELEIEAILKKEFPLDQINEVKKGVNGADITQLVFDKSGRECGTILWETKNGKWSGGWIPKLKEDARLAHAHISILVAVNPPEDIKTYAYREGVWVTTRAMVAALASVLRFNLYNLMLEQSKNQNKTEKQEILWAYITSHDFQARIEAMMENYNAMQTEIEREKRWFLTKWARQDKQLRTLIDHTNGVYGDLQGVVGKSLPDIAIQEIGLIPNTTLLE
ncbi:MAG: DUF2130 domain-containing protein [bacterium]